MADQIVQLRVIRHRGAAIARVRRRDRQLGLSLFAPQSQTLDENASANRGCLARGAPDPLGRRRSRRWFTASRERKVRFAKTTSRSASRFDLLLCVSSRAWPRSPRLTPRGRRRGRRRGRARSRQPDPDARDVEQRQEAALRLVVASANRPEALQLMEADLDEIANPVELAVRALGSLPGTRWSRSRCQRRMRHLARDRAALWRRPSRAARWAST